MESNNRLRLWRVEWVHRNGYQAPYQIVEAKKYKEVHKFIMESGSRLLNFPNSWSFVITDLHKTQKNGKWYDF